MCLPLDPLTANQRRLRDVLHRPAPPCNVTDDRIEPLSWRPKFVDYLYVSLTNAMAFSPTDTMPLTPMAKIVMGVQSIVSLITIGLIVSRAINIL